MILDASVTIALRSPQDAHAERASAMILGAEYLVLHPVTLAETLVAPARVGMAAEVRSLLLTGLGIQLWAPDDEEPQRVALLRARSRVALPDCYPLAVAQRADMALATFDEQLAAAARAQGVTVV